MSMLTLVAGQVKVFSTVQICCKTLNKAPTAIIYLGIDHHSLVFRKGGAVVVMATDPSLLELMPQPM